MSDKISALAAGQEFELGPSSEVLADIIENKMRTISFDPQDAYKTLSEANKRALAHLVKAASVLDTVFLKQDHPDDIRARDVLREAAQAGDGDAERALTLWTIFNGVEGYDLYAPKTVPFRLFKNKELKPGRAYYPQDITKDELADYIAAHPEQAAALLSNNTIVSRRDGRLVAEPYSVVFRDEMEACAHELLAAARETDHAAFASYLRWQAQALVNDSDPEAMYNADKAWAGLEDSPLEFTIGRESYEDELSSEVATDPRVHAVLCDHALVAKAKDAIGVRVGIVNKESYAKISMYRHSMAAVNEQVPFLERYRDQLGDLTQSKMTFADVDLVCFSGDYASIRRGISVAQNLPNSDKLAVQLKAGNRSVFHRQVRQDIDQVKLQKFLDALVDPAQHGLYDPDADFLHTIGHELVHSLGPVTTADGRDKKVSLGAYGDMLEENKADLGSILWASYFVSTGAFSNEEANKIYMTWTADMLPVKQPVLQEAHRMRELLQLNYFMERGAVHFEKGGKLSIVPEKMGPVAKEMLADVISLQLKGDAKEAQTFVERYAVWTEAFRYAADEQLKLKPKRYRLIRQPMRDRLLAM